MEAIAVDFGPKAVQIKASSQVETRLERKVEQIRIHMGDDSHRRIARFLKSSVLLDRFDQDQEYVSVHHVKVLLGYSATAIM
jgi:hypothetical protein